MKKVHFTKLIGLLVLAVAFLLISACSQSAPTEEATEAVEPEEPAAEEEASEEEATEAVEPEEPAAEEEASEEEVAPEFDWKAYDGTALTVYVADTGQMQYITPKLAEFEELTGMTVEVETADATGYRNGAPVRLAAQSSDFDVMATFPSVDGLQFAANGWYEPLDAYIADPALTSPDFNFADFPEGAQNSMKVNGELVTVLWEMQTDLIYYRSDVLEEAGLEVPATFDEWLAAAEAVHDPGNDFYGVALRGNGYQITTPYSAFLYGNCGTWLDSDGNANVNSPEAVKAFVLYRDFGQLGPPGIVNFDWQVPAQQFAQGKVFMFLDINLFVPTLEDPEQSAVVGNVGYAPVPEGDCGRSPFIGGWGWGINPFSENKEAAWYFIQWATSAEINLEMKLDGWPSPRASAWQSAEFKAQDPTPQFTEVVLTSLEIAAAEMNPPVAPGKEAREVVGVVGTRALEGASEEELQAVADEQNIALQALIDAME